MQQQGTSVSADEQAIRDVVQRWHALTAAGDVDGVLELMTGDVVFLVAGREQPMRGREAFSQGLREILATHRIESDGEIREVAISGDLAYCWATLDVRVTPLAGGQTRRRRGDVLSVYRRHADGRWQLARDANLLVAVDD
jgi:uncharacterized protein (TIGR02246 family)